MTQQGSLLGQLLDPAVLARIRDAELRAEPGRGHRGAAGAVRLADRSDLVRDRRRGARPRWCARATSARCGATSSGCYLNALIQMAVSPPPGTPEDARALARVTLAGLGGDIDRALAVPRPDLDAYTRAHLSDARDRIARALDAQMIQTTTFSR